jgi:uncharacterized membrane protein
MTSVEAPTATTPATRVSSIDIIRGAVMVLMAIDHVRVYSGLPAGGPTPGIFFTRWVTHFCAPAFLFLAGTILMSGLVQLPLRVVAAIGLAIIAGHNLFDAQLQRDLGADLTSNLWRIFYVGFYAGPVRLGPNGPNLMVLYSIVPWIGVMAAGYAFGSIVTEPAGERRRRCLLIGGAAVLLFLVLRTFNLYGDPNHWSPSGRLPAALSFLSATKYPASLDFLLMTLGPTILLIPLLDGARGWLARALTVFGRVPFFYYALQTQAGYSRAIAIA